MSTTKTKIAFIFFTLLYLFSSTVIPTFAAITYTYDADGNMSSDGTNCYTYNDANQLSQVKNCGSGQVIAQYTYDYQGNRIEKKEYVNGSLQQTVYSPTKEYETKKLANNTVQNTTYYYANTQLLARKNPDSSKTYYQNDNLNSANILTDQNGNLVEKTTYYPYGEIRSGGTQSKYLYTGQENDSETGLDYYNSRYYNSHIHRFIQADTLLPNVYNPQALNRYSYVGNNPLTYTDPTGHFWDELAEMIMNIPIVGNIITKIPVVSNILEFIANPESTEVEENPTTQNVAKQVINKVQTNTAAENIESNAASKVTNNPATSKTEDTLINNSSNLLEKDINIGSKIQQQMGSRGWTQDMVKQAVNDPVRTVVTRDTRYLSDGTQLNDPATAYYAKDGSYVVVNDLNNDVVQISNKFKDNWIAPWDK